MGRGEEVNGRGAGPLLRPVETAPAAERDVGVRVAGVAKSFGTVRALSAVDFEIRRGEFVSVLGPSGCGKSTLLRIVAGLIAPDVGGSVEILGEPQRAPSESVGVVFQTHNMLPWMTVAANIRLAAEVRGLPAAEIDRRVDAILPVLRLDRIYVRGLKVKSAQVHSGHPWSRISDHSPLTAKVSLA